MRARIIPTLLLDANGSLIKTVRFQRRTYIGDPINAVRIFSTKEVDELIVLDIDATRLRRPPNYALIEEIASEAFMPVAYGGGLHDADDVDALFSCGVEKVIFSSSLISSPDLLPLVAGKYGRQATVACITYSRRWPGRCRPSYPWAGERVNADVAGFAAELVMKGAGELLLYSIDRDGTYAGYDLETLEQVTRSMDVPVIPCGGASSVNDFRAAIERAKCSAVAAGSLFVFQGQGKGVLISYPAEELVSAEARVG